MPADRYSPGAWNAICDRCGRKFKSFEMQKTWQGWYVCRRCWEPRHPQDFVRGVQERPVPPWVRPPQVPVDPPPRQLPALFLPPAEPRWRRGDPRILLERNPLPFPRDPFLDSVLLLLVPNNTIGYEASQYHHTLIDDGMGISATHPYGSLNTYFADGGNARLGGDDSIYYPLDANEWCLEMWVKPVTEVFGTTETRLQYLSSLRTEFDEANDRFLFNVQLSSSSYSAGSSNGSVITGNWYHLCLIRDNSPGGNNCVIQMSIDGALVASTATFNIANTVDDLNTFDSVLGGPFASLSAWAGLRMTNGTRRYTSGQFGYGSGYPFTPDPPYWPGY